MPAIVRRLLQVALLTLALSVLPFAGRVSAAPSPAAVAPSSLLALFRPATSLPIASVTATSMARTVAILLNRDRESRGLVPLRVDSRLTRTALERAQWMASHNLMTHTSAHGSILAAEHYWNVRPSLAGECVGWTNAAWGTTAARWLYNEWKNSPEHWGLLMSPTFTRVGIGFGYRASGHITYGSVALARV